MTSSSIDHQPSHLQELPDPFEPWELAKALGAAVLVVIALFVIVGFLTLPVAPV